MMELETSWLRAFAAFAQHCNMSRAARELHLSQPAVHAQLQKLAEATGAPLYRRVGRGLALTDEGIEVAAFARESTERERVLLERLHRGRDDSRVVLAAGSGAFLWVLPAALREFRSRERARIELVSADAPAAIEAVRVGSAHVGVGVVEDALPAPLVGHLVTEVPQKLVLPRAHRLARRRRVSPRDLAGEALVVPPLGRPHRATLATVLATTSTPWKVGAVASGWELMLRFVELGAGIAVVNACVAIPRGLIAIPMQGMPSVRYMVFTRPKPTEGAAALVRAIRAEGESWRRR